MLTGIPQQWGFAIGLIEHKPAGIAPLKLSWHPLPFGSVPDDLGGRIALADRVENIEQLIVKAIAANELAHVVGRLNIFLFIAGRFDRHFEPGDLTFARREDGGVMGVALLHVLGQLKVALGIELDRLAQDLRQSSGREANDRVLAKRSANAGVGRGGLPSRRPRENRSKAAMIARRASRSR